MCESVRYMQRGEYLGYVQRGGCVSVIYGAVWVIREA